MDFLDPKKKRAHTIRLYIGYFLMAIALSIGTLILLFEAFGYDYNRSTGEVIQNSTLYVDTHPEQGDIFINGKFEGQTDKRLALPSGQYDIRVHRNGYREWNRSMKLEGGIIERLNYIFLFPEQLNTSDIQLYNKSPSFATQSPDRKWLIVERTDKHGSFDVMNLGEDNNPVTQFELPAGLMSTPKGTRKLEPIEWSTDNRHFIIKHTFTGGSEFIMVDREKPNESININKTFNVSPAQVAMRDKKFDKLHILDTKGSLRFGDSKTKQLTVIANKVEAFKSYSDDVILYVTREGNTSGNAVALIRRGNKVFKIRDLPQAKIYLVDITRFENEWFLAIANDTEKRAYVYKEIFRDVDRDNPRIPVPIDSLKIDKTPEYLSISANSQFIGLQGGSEFAVYDTEYDRSYKFDTKLKLAPKQKAYWIDGHRYALVSENKLVVVEFNGINQQTLTNAYPSFQPFFDRDYDNLYMLMPSISVKERAAITKTPMRISGDL